MHIVVLDGHTLNPGDLDWEPLTDLGDCTIHERTAVHQIVDRCHGAEAVLTNKVPFSAKTLAALPDLRYIGVVATGYNIVDTEAARRLGITVTNVPAYSTASVAQTVFAHILNISQRVDHYARETRDGVWTAAPDFSYWNTPLVELAGKTLGIIGYGQIGRAVGNLGHAFGMQVIAASRSPIRQCPDWLKQVTIDYTFSNADFLSLHCPLTPDTEGLVNTRRLGMMKRSAVLINTGRGPLVDETALAAALRHGKLAAAGLDVLSSEPPSADNPLLEVANCYITPHQGWATREARIRLYDTVVANLRAWKASKAQNVVS